MLKVLLDVCAFRRSLLPIKNIRESDTSIQTQYAPTMPIISYLSFDLSLDAPADSGGPLSGGGAGDSRML